MLILLNLIAVISINSMSAYAQDRQTLDINLKLNDTYSRAELQLADVIVSTRAGECWLIFQTNSLGCTLDRSGDLYISRGILQTMAVIAQSNIWDYWERRNAYTIASTLRDSTLPNYFGPIKSKRKKPLHQFFVTSSGQQLSISFTTRTNRSRGNR